MRVIYLVLFFSITLLLLIYIFLPSWFVAIATVTGFVGLCVSIYIRVVSHLQSQEDRKEEKKKSQNKKIRDEENNKPIFITSGMGSHQFTRGGSYMDFLNIGESVKYLKVKIDRDDVLDESQNNFKQEKEFRIFEKDKGKFRIIFLVTPEFEWPIEIFLDYQDSLNNNWRQKLLVERGEGGKNTKLNDSFPREKIE